MDTVDYATGEPLFQISTKNSISSVGELACGNLKNRAEILTLLQALPMVNPMDHEEVLQFISNHSLMGKGLGYIDMHLLAAALVDDFSLWTLDKKLRSALPIIMNHGSLLLYGY